jgi:iron complex transport system permease protein
LAACACGVSLAVSGALLQAALDNDLASPQVMGISAGAGFFALAGTLLFPFSGVARQLMALVGALVSTLMVYLVARRAGAARTTLVLAGVAVSSLMSAGSNAIVTIWPKTVVDKLAFSLGGLTGATVSQLTLSAPFMVAGLGAALLLAPGLDLLALGDETAIGLGLDVRRHRVVAIVCAATLAAAAVSVCGMLGFVGLMVPNLVRMAVRCGLRWGLPLCAIWGAVLLVTCDLLARVLFFPYELPAGLLLSLLGAPFFIMLLMRRRRPR